MSEDPKQFLKEVKSGIGESRIAETGEEIIDFLDASGAMCRAAVSPRFDQIALTSLTGRILLDSGQAQRLANTLQRFAIAHDLGKPEGS